MSKVLLWVDGPGTEPGSLQHAEWTQDGWTLCANIHADDDADTSYLEQEDFEERLAQYENGAFSFIGVTVTASRADRVIGRSGGLWGIESDSDTDYLTITALGEAEQAIEDANARLEAINSPEPEVSHVA